MASAERGPLKLQRGSRYTLYTISIGVWVTGGLWLIFHYFMRTQGPFGFSNNPLEIWWLRLHGGFSFASLWVFGLLWNVHVVRGWNMRWRRWSGGFLTGVMFVLTLTGFGLYYLVSKDWREWTSIIHWVVGLGALAAFLIHWLSNSMPRREHEPYPWPWFRKRHPVERGAPGPT